MDKIRGHIIRSRRQVERIHAELIGASLIVSLQGASLSELRALYFCVLVCEGGGSRRAPLHGTPLFYFCRA